MKRQRLQKLGYTLRIRLRQIRKLRCRPDDNGRDLLRFLLLLLALVHTVSFRVPIVLFLGCDYTQVIIALYLGGHVLVLVARGLWNGKAIFICVKGLSCVSHPSLLLLLMKL